MMTHNAPFDRVVQALGARVVRPTPRGVLARCPAHDDHDPSLSVDRGDDGNVLLRCRSRNCSAEAICEAVGLDVRELFTAPLSNGPVRDRPRGNGIDWRALHKQFVSSISHGQVQQYAAELHVDLVALVDLGAGYAADRDTLTFPMFAADGSVSGIKTRGRNGEKGVRQGGKLGVFRRQAPTDDSDGPLTIAEGESDCLALLSYGYDAIGTPGAGQCADIVAAYCLDRDVVIVRDNDEPGARGAATIAAAVRDVAKSVRIVVPPAKDVRAWRAEGASREDVDGLIASSKLLAEKPRGQSPQDVIERWRTEGRLVHVPTGIAALDQVTRGGPIFGQLWGVTGPPDAAKTALMVEIADGLRSAGVLVGVLAIDEDPDGLLTRFAQRAGFNRDDCEQRGAQVLADIEQAIGELPVRFFGDEFTIDSAAEQLAAEATRFGMRAVLLVDSLQTAKCTAESSASNRYEQVSARITALRTTARQHRLVVMFTSEQNRANYKTAERDHSLSEMSAGKQTGDIEYSSKVLLSLRATDDSDRFELRVVKNKHGRSHTANEPGIFLLLDRHAQRLTEAPASTQAVTDESVELAAKADARIGAVIATVANMGGHAASARSIVDRTPGRRQSLYAAIKDAVSASKLIPDGDGFRLVVPVVPGGSRVVPGTAR